jgi:hypothetical protein
VEDIAMTEPTTTKPELPAKPEFSDDDLALIGANRAMLRPWLTGNRILYEYLVIAFVFGLIAHVVGYWLRTSITGEPIRLVADLVYAMGGALWTGVVVVGFVQVFPDQKRAQIKRALAAVEARKRGKAKT